MLNLLCPLPLLLLVQITFGQLENKSSIEGNVNLYHYFLGSEYKNRLNYGYSVLVSKQINQIKISTGINYSTKFYYYETDPQFSLDSLNSRDYSLQYLNLPILVSIQTLTTDHFNASVLLGFWFNKIMDYKVVSEYSNRSPIIETNIETNQKLGLSFSVGFTISKALSKNLMMNFTPSINYKLVSDHFNQRPDYKSLVDDKIMAGVKLGLEYFIK